MPFTSEIAGKPRTIFHVYVIYDAQDDRAREALNSALRRVAEK